MKKLLLSLVMFSILLNFSVALMINVIPAFQGMDEKLGLNSNDIVEYMDEGVLDEFGNPVNGLPAAEDSSNLNANTLMDRIGIGAILNLKNFLNKYMFGFIEVLRAVFGAYVSPAIFTGLKSIIGIVYFIASIELLTGKRVND